LVFKGKTLDNEQTLKEQNVEENNFLIIINSVMKKVEKVVE